MNLPKIAERIVIFLLYAQLLGQALFIGFVSGSLLMIFFG